MSVWARNLIRTHSCYMDVYLCIYKLLSVCSLIRLTYKFLLATLLFLLLANFLLLLHFYLTDLMFTSKLFIQIIQLIHLLKNMYEECNIFPKEIGSIPCVKSLDKFFDKLYYSVIFQCLQSIKSTS